MCLNSRDTFEATTRLLGQVGLIRQSPYLALNIQISDTLGVSLDEGFAGRDFTPH